MTTRAIALFLCTVVSCSVGAGGSSEASTVVGGDDSAPDDTAASSSGGASGATQDEPDGSSGMMPSQAAGGSGGNGSSGHAGNTGSPSSGAAGTGSGGGAAGQVGPTGEHKETITAGGVSTSYYLLAPASADQTKGPVPLLVAFHGLGDTAMNFTHTCGYDTEAPHLADDAGQYGFILAAPEPYDPSGETLDPMGQPDLSSTHPAHWGGAPFADNVKLVDRLVKDVSSKYRIDAHRIYCFGFSNGAIFVGDLYMYSNYTGSGAVAGWSNPFAACIANSGGAESPSGDVGHDSPKPPIWVVWGGADGSNSGESLVDVLKSGGWPVTSTIEPGKGHHCLVHGSDLWSYYSKNRTP
jgi:predicted esterase